MIRLLISILSLTLFARIIQAQPDTAIYYLISDFETVEDQQRWQSLPTDNYIKWVTNATGGHLGVPLTAASGTKNALFYYAAFDPYIRTLVSQPIDLSKAELPELSFYHAMVTSDWGTDNLALLFRAGATGDWETIEIYENEVENWSLRTFNILDYGEKYRTKEFYVAFQGVANAGWGVCIDKVLIEEKGVIQRYVQEVNFRQINHSLIPAGVTDIPVARADLVIAGNTGQITLKSLEFRSISSSDNLFESNGFELVITNDSIYKPTDLTRGSLKIGTPVSISDGVVTFSDLNIKLPTGFTSLWLVADIKSDAPHNSIVDFMLEADKIMLSTGGGDITYPAASISPAGSNRIEESVFLDSFETSDKGWTFSPEPNVGKTNNDFEMEAPLNKAAGTTKDPDCAFSGNKVLGTDLTMNGAYLQNINSTNAYYAISPVFNLKYYGKVKLNFMKWLAFQGNDQALIEVSTDMGATWNTIWDSRTDALVADNKWTELSIFAKFNELAARKPWVQVRFGIVYSDNSTKWAGWNIDNFSITGDFLSNDVGITAIHEPVNDCMHPGTDYVSITVRNYGANPTETNLPVFFSVDGVAKVYGQIPGPIPVDGETTFTFSQPANITVPGAYNKFNVTLEVPGDEDALNDTLYKVLYIQNNLSVPSLETFETGNGYWIREAKASNNTWNCIVPEGGFFPPIPGSPKAWVVSFDGNYLSNDSSFVVSSCYDLATNDSLLVEMDLWLNSEQGNDGARLEYTTDDGVAWKIINNNNTHGWNWNWYNGYVSAFESDGWSGEETGWFKVKQLLPAYLANEPKVKFRMRWESDGDTSLYRGVAFDNFSIYPAPPDIGVTAIDSFADRCQYQNPDKLTVTVKNMGINALRQNDTIIVGFDLNQSHMATDTFRLAHDLLPGQTVKHTFNQKVDVRTPGNYNITAYTLIEDDPWFYLGNNDTLSVDFEVYPGPVVDLIDTIQTRRPDTVVIRPFSEDNYDYLWHDGSPGREYHVKDAGWQFVTITDTDGNGCFIRDSVYVELLFYDVGADDLLLPDVHCGMGRNDFITVNIRNYGTDSIASGQRIAVVYELNGGQPVADTLQLQETLYSNSIAEFTFKKGAVNLAEKGIYSFRIYTKYAGDTIPSNDTVYRSIEILGRPDVSLGPDISVQAFTHILDAGAGYEGYLWDNGETIQTREISKSGTYWVRVTDENMCDNYDTVSVWFKIRDISTAGIENPASGCSFNESEPLTLRLINSGTDTVPSGSPITVSYRFMEQERVTDIVVLDENLIPGASVTHTFAQTLDLSNPGDYTLEAAVSHPGDLRPDNDTVKTIIYRYPKPVVDFGLAAIEYIEDVSFELDAGYDPYYIYEWQDPEHHTHLYEVTALTGLYHVKVTDTRTLCYDRDTVRVFLIYGDIGVTWTDFPENACTGEFNNTKVRVTNLGSSAIGSDAPIYIACDIDGSRVITQTLTRTGNFNPGAKIELTMSEKIAITGYGSHKVAFYTLLGLDKNHVNDTIAVEFNRLQQPDVDFGEENGVLRVGFPYTLDAGAGHKSYLWQDGSTGRTITAAMAGNYSVTVTGQNDCITEKSVRVEAITGINDHTALSGITIYPNPGDGLLWISGAEGMTGDITIRIFDNTGQVVFADTHGHAYLRDNKPIDMQHLARGLYHIIIQSGDKIFTGKIIIQ